MNQILSTNNNSNNNKNAINIKRIIAIFCVIILLFGLIIAGKSGYELYKKRSARLAEKQIEKPEIGIEELEDGTLKISAKYTDGLSKITYTWNKTDKKEINLNGKQYIEKQIEMPGNPKDTLEVSAIGVNGVEESIAKEYTKQEEGAPDTQDPTIDWVVETALQIIAEDETAMAYLTYRWAGDQEVIVKPNGNEKKIEETIEIKRGTNELTVAAVDTSGNTISKTRTFKGVKEPEVSWIKQDNIVEMSITHDMGFKKIIFIVNNVEYVYDSNYSNYNSSQTEVKFKTELQPGDNSIIIKAYSNEDSEKIKEGKATYNP